MPLPKVANYNTQGGYRTATFYSGITAGPGLTAAPGAVAAGTGVLIYSGAGRLNSVVPFNGTISGTQVLFYDSATPNSGGPQFALGHQVLGSVPAWPSNTGLSGGLNPALPIALNTPFQSGLCVDVRSGCPAFTVIYTPEKLGDR